eukprot:5017379-Amphidinium_carterae.4
MTAKCLGIVIGRGAELDLSIHAQEKLRSRGSVVADLGLGSPQAMRLYQVVCASCVRHALSRRAISRQRRHLEVGDSRFWAREVHAWPAHVPHLDVQCFQATPGVLPRLEVNPIVVHQDLVERSRRADNVVLALPTRWLACSWQTVAHGHLGHLLRIFWPLTMLLSGATSSHWVLRVPLFIA